MMESVFHAPQVGRRFISTPRSMGSKKSGRRRRSSDNSDSSPLRPLLSSPSQSTVRKMMTATVVTPEGANHRLVSDPSGMSSPFSNISRAATPSPGERQRTSMTSPTPQGTRHSKTSVANKQRRTTTPSRRPSPPLSAPASPGSTSSRSLNHHFVMHAQSPPSKSDKHRPSKDGETTITTTTASTTSAWESSHISGVERTSPDQDLLPTAALECSSRAASCLQQEDFEGALHWYQRALMVYQKQKASRAAQSSLQSSSCADIVDTCNAAATLHNMGAVCKVLQIGTHAVRCCEEAENLYRVCQTRINQLPASHTQVLSEDLLQSQECVCLTLQVAETLQHRAAMYESVVRDDVACIECHEECIELLRDAPVQGEVPLAGASWNIDEDDEKDPTLCPVILAEDVYFRLHVPADARLDVLAISYQTLARLYRYTDSPRDGLEALKDLRTLLEGRLEVQLQRAESTAHVRKLLATCWKHQSEYHFALKEYVDAVNALHRAMDIRLEAASGLKDIRSQLRGDVNLEVSTELLEQMNNFGCTQELQGDYDKALASYEKVLLVRSQFLGEDHLDVAETLVKIGRVMEAQGNVGGGLDLYHAAHAIYQAAVKRAEEDEQESTTHAATESVVRIANVLMGQKRWQEAVDFLLDLPQVRPIEQALQVGQHKDEDGHSAKSTDNADSEHKSISPLPSVDQAIVFRELGRAYMGMGCLTKAKHCLLKSACQLEGTEHEEDVFELLTHVEFLHKERINSPERRHHRRKGGRRSRSKSSSHSRAHSASSSGTTTSEDYENSKITSEVVAAVLSLKPDTSTSTSTNGSIAQLSTGTPTVCDSCAVSIVPNPKDKAAGKRLITKVAQASAAVPHGVARQPEKQASESNHKPVQHSSRSIGGTPLVLEEHQVQGLSKGVQQPSQDSDADPPLFSDYVSTSSSSSDKMLGILSAGKMSPMTSTVENLPVSSVDKTNKGPLPLGTPDAVQRARAIILKKIVENDYRSSLEVAQVDDDGILSHNHGCSSENTLNEDEQKSDVKSAVLLGLDINFDLPPSSPAANPLSGISTRHGGGQVKQCHSDRPFDEPSSSNSSAAPDAAQALHFDLSTPYPLVVKQRLLQIADHNNGTALQASGSERIRQLKYTLGDDYAQKSGAAHDDESKISSSDPLSLTLTSSVSFPVTSVASGSSEATTSATSASKPIKTILSTGNDTESVRECKDINENCGLESSDRDDYSSDPFEGYDDYGDDEVSDGQVTTGDSGNSESEEEYEHFANEDLSSSGCYSAEKDTHVNDSHPLKVPPPNRFKGNRQNKRMDDGRLLASRQPRSPTGRFDDYRQPLQNHDTQIEAFASADRESPITSSNSTDGKEELDSLNQNMRRQLAASARDISPTLRVTAENSHDYADTFSCPGLPDNREVKVLNTEKEARLELQEQSDHLRAKENFLSPASAARDSPGNRIVKAFSNSLRLRRNQNSGFNPLDSPKEGAVQNPVLSAVVHDSDARLRLPHRNFIEGLDEIDREVTGTGSLPIPFVALSPSYDDAVSQITFINDELVTSKIVGSRNNQWWGQLGLSTERLEGWFPANSYLNQAVEAAEGFLSAKSIHAQVKSKPFDISSVIEEDEDRDEDVVDYAETNLTPSSKPPVPTTGQIIPSSPGANSLLFSTDSKSSPEIGVACKDNKQDQVTTLNLMHTPTRTPRAGSLQPDDSYGTKEVLLEISECERLLKTYEEKPLDNKTMNPAVASTLFRLSLLQVQNNDVGGAMKSALEALRLQNAVGDAIEASRSLHLLADIHVRQEKYEAALSRYAEIQKLELQIYGYIHEETATTLNRIGSVHARLGQFGLAMEKHKEALKILKECHGEELRHPLVSQTLIHIGAVYYRERNSVEGATRSCDGYSTFIEAGMLEVIGRAHEDRGSYKMAISFFEEKLQYLNKNRGDPKSADDIAELEDIAATLNSLGMLCCRAGIFMEAIDYYDNALEIQKKIGCDKMHVATARVLTATVQFHLGYFHKALRLLQDALEELQIETGEDHETVAATWFQIGVVQVALCNYDDAMDALEEALRIQNKVIGSLHPATLRTRREIGNMFAIYETELPAAFEQFYDILETQKRIHGAKHPNVAETLHSLGCAYARRGDYTTSIRTLEECYYMRIEFLGADHPLQATTLYEIAQIHMKRGRFKKAIHICHSVLGIRKESLSEQHIDVAKALATQGSCLVGDGDHSEGKKCLAKALSMAEQAVGSRHPTVADIYVQVGLMYLRKCHFDEARESVSKALNILHNSNLDEDHPAFLEARSLVQRVERDEMLCV